MLPSHVIKRPILTEKSTFGMNELKQYSFLVDRRATKKDIKAAVETLYSVRVSGVNTQVRKSRTKMTKFGLAGGDITKKATVRVHAEDTIELF